MACATLLGVACAGPPSAQERIPAESPQAQLELPPMESSASALEPTPLAPADLTPPAPLAASALSWPIQGPILSGFGARRGRRHHQGIDIKAPRGTIVRAAEAGHVSESRWRRGYGNVVSIDHGDGVRTVYAHLAELRVRRGAWVEQGEPIATVGATGNATTPHLHFEVRREGRARDPLAWLPGASDTVASPADLP